MEEKHLEWEANPKETKQNKIIFKKVAQRSVSPGNPDLVLEQLMGLGGLKLNQCSRILSNYDFFMCVFNIDIISKLWVVGESVACNQLSCLTLINAYKKITLFCSLDFSFLFKFHFQRNVVKEKCVWEQF